MTVNMLKTKPATLKARQDFSLRRSDVFFLPLDDGMTGWALEVAREGPDGAVTELGVFSGAVEDDLFPALLIALMSV